MPPNSASRSRTSSGWRRDRRPSRAAARSPSATSCGTPCGCDPIGSVVGEVRGGEALDMLQVMNTGHDGLLSTAHANSARHALWRLETMAMMSDVELPVAHVRAQVSSAIDVVVHTARLRDGR